MSSPQQNNAPTFLFDAFCSEDESFGEVIDPTHFTSRIFTDFLENGFLWDSDDDENLGILLNKEKSENETMYNGLERTPFLAQCRDDAVEWILKVVGHYSFSALTAFLAVNFLDRFLCKFESHGEKKPWVAHLAAVACLSLAAKVEETHVPLLLDLQVEECKYVFKSKTIQRMELLVLSTLEWKINPVTPISFLDFITKRLSLKTHISEEFIIRYECLVLSTVTTDCRYMSHLPSTLATATMLSVINSLEPCIRVDYHHQLIGILGTKNKDKVEDCLRLIQEVESSNKRKFNGTTLFCSSKGAMGISLNSESSYESWASVSSSVVNSSPEHLSKRIKSNRHIS